MTAKTLSRSYPSQDQAEMDLIRSGWFLVHVSESGGGLIFKREANPRDPSTLTSIATIRRMEGKVWVTVSG